MNITRILSQELSATTVQINAAIELLDDGATVPFIARYRKEATGGLDDTQLRQLAERLQYLRELEERATVVLKALKSKASFQTTSGRKSKPPTTKPRWKTCTCPTNPNAAPKRKSLANTVCSRWRTCCLPNSRRTWKPPRKAT